MAYLPLFLVAGFLTVFLGMKFLLLFLFAMSVFFTFVYLVDKWVEFCTKKKEKVSLSPEAFSRKTDSSTKLDKEKIKKRVLEEWFGTTDFSWLKDAPPDEIGLDDVLGCVDLAIEMTEKELKGGG